MQWLWTIFKKKNSELYILIKQIAYKWCSTFKDELNMRIIRVGGMSKNIEKESLVLGTVYVTIITIHNDF